MGEALNKNEKFYKKKPPKKIIEAVQLIENWASSVTDRDDWVIGGIACRKGFERLLKLYQESKNG